MNIEEFRSYLEIDKTALDDVVTQQPMLFYKVSEAFVRAASERDALKERLAIVDAELDSEIREKLEAEEIKITETNVKSKVQTHKRHETAFKSYIKAKEQADVLQALKEAFHQRSFMIRDLCSLYVANFFEEGSVKGNNQTDNVQYRERRRLLSDARQERPK